MKRKSIFLALAADALLSVLAVLFALSLQWNVVSFGFTGEAVVFVVLAVAGLLTGLYLGGLYHRIWHYASIKDFINVIFAVTGSAIFISFISAIFLPQFSLRAVPGLWAAALILFGGSRFLRRLMWDYANRAGVGSAGKKTLIIGAGEAGALIVRTLQSTKTSIDMEPIGYIDDDPGKKGLRLYGLPVLGTRTDIPEVVRNFAVKEVIIAIPSAVPGEIKDIARICSQTGVKVKFLPSVLDIVEGKNILGQMRELQMEDLLHRSEVTINLEQVSSYVRGQAVLVTGAGGSIGSELCRQICAFRPRVLLLLGRGENSIYDIRLELAGAWPEVPIIPVIADIRDQEKLSAVFARYKPAVVFHAAAHKHVDLMEQHPDEAFKNNVFGTLNLARMADFFDSDIFVLISTDKAVNPSCAMGLTKLLAEMVIRHYAGMSRTKFVAVRFGNVLGSRGSVVHLFRRQIAAGGPVTVTHPEMRRYFMTIWEAVQLVLQAGALARGGEVFVLDMGDQIRIVDLAREMIQLSGLYPDKDIAIKFVGIRPGEKLSEELLTEKEKTEATQHQKIFIVDTGAIDHHLMKQVLSVKGFPAPKQLADLMDTALGKFNLAANKKEGLDCESGSYN